LYKRSYNNWRPHQMILCVITFLVCAQRATRIQQILYVKLWYPKIISLSKKYQVEVPHYFFGHYLVSVRSIWVTEFSEFCAKDTSLHIKKLIIQRNTVDLRGWCPQLCCWVEYKNNYSRDNRMENRMRLWAFFFCWKLKNTNTPIQHSLRKILRGNKSIFRL